MYIFLKQREASYFGKLERGLVDIPAKFLLKAGEIKRENQAMADLDAGYIAYELGKLLPVKYGMPTDEELNNLAEVWQEHVADRWDTYN